MSIKILLADDSITIQKVIGIIFGGEDYALTVVDNGKAAVDKAREIAPDVLLIDAIMPGMSGYDVCEAIRAIPALATKPILLLTGSFEPFDEAKANSCGADDFLAKPFESQQIVGKVKSLYELGISRAAAAVRPEPIPEPAPATPHGMPTSAPASVEPAPQANIEDIWAAFTMDAEPTPATPPQPTAPTVNLEPDVFAIINEEPDAQIPPPLPIPPAQNIDTGSQWIPVEEHTFEFSEETITELPTSSFSEQASTATETSFGDISFEETPIPVKEEGAFVAEPPPIRSAGTFTEEIIPGFAEDTATAADRFGIENTEPNTISRSVEPLASVALTEEQLKAAIAGVSQEIIQKIVWEVVPDLAETLIKEAIRKIKEGM